MSRYFLADKGQDKDDIGQLIFLFNLIYTSNNLGLFKTAVAGSVAGMTLWTAIFPADVVKSKMQVQGGTAKQITLDILKTDGMFFKVRILLYFIRFQE
jgi:putative effector of murein hydrolase LrgA (UPF0299 family)